MLRIVVLSTLFLICQFSYAQSEIKGFQLINADQDSDILTLVDGIEIVESDIQGISLNIRADSNPTVVGSVILVLQGPENITRTENVAPYALYGDSGGDYFPAALPIGDYVISATPYSSSGGNGTAGTSLSINFSIVTQPANQAPTASAEANVLSGVAPLDVAFTGSNSTDESGITDFLWDFGDGGSSTNPDASYTYTQPGNYSAILSVTDAGGLQDSDTLAITATDPNQPPVAVALADTTSGEAPLDVAFDGSTSSDDAGITAYLWDFADGATDSIASPVHSFINPGNYQVLLTVSDGQGLSDTDTLNISVSPPANQPPVAIALSDLTSGTAPLDVAFDGSTSSDDTGITAYLWDFGDASTDSIASPAHSFINPGNYQVLLTVSDAQGLSDTDTLNISVSPPANQPPVAIALADTTSGEAPLDVAFDGSTSSDDTGITAYLWDFGDGATDSIASPVHSFINPGNYQVLLTVSDGQGLSDTDTLNISVSAPANQPPVAIALSDLTSGTAPLDVAFDGSTSSDDTGITAYLWNFGDASTDSIASPAHSFINPGNYQVLLTVSDAQGLSDTDTLNISVSAPANQPPVAIALSDLTSGTAPLDVAFDASTSSDDAGITDYLWDFADGSTDSIASPAHSFINPGNYQVLLTVSDGQGLSDTDTLNISVSAPANQPPVAIALSDLTSGTAPLDVAFDGSTSSDDTGITAYLWDFGDASTDSIASPAHSFTNPGNYQVLLTVSDGQGLSDTDTLNISVSPPANQPPVAIALSDLTSGTAPLEVAFDGSTSSDDAGITAYLWDFADGATDSIASPAHSFINPGNYQVLLTVSDGQGLSDTDTLNISVSAPANQPPVALAGSASPTSGDAPLTVDFVGSGSTDDAPGLTFSWDFGDGGNDTIPDPSYTYTQPGNYSAILSVTDAGGLQDSDTLAITATDPNQPPVAVALADTTSGEAPLDVAFDGSTSSDDAGITAYLWDFGDASTDSIASPVHSFINPGNYQVLLTVSDGQGLSDTDTLNISVRAPANQPPVAIALSDLTSGTAPLDVAFDGSTSSDDTGITAYLWDFADGATDSIASPAHSFINPGNYQVLLTVSDGQGLSDTDTLNISVSAPANQPPVAIALSDLTSGTAPLDVAFDGSTSSDDAGITDYLWDFADGSTDSIASPVHSFINPGNYQVLLTVSDGQGLSDTDTLNISVSAPANQPPVAIALSDLTSGTAPLDVAFDGSGSTDDAPGLTFSWDFGDGGNDTFPDPSYTYTQPGNYSAILSVTDAGGLQDSDTLNISVSPPANQHPVANASANPLSGDAPLIVNFIGNASTDDSAVVSYAWDFDDGGTSNEANPTHTYTTIGSFNATLVVSDIEGLQDSTNVIVNTLDPDREGVISFTLIDTDNDTDLFEIQDGMNIVQSTIGGMGLSIRVNTNPDTVGSVFLSLTGPLNHSRTENVVPYSLYGDSNGNYAGVSFPLGTYTMSATAYSGYGLGGTILGTLTVQFTITNQGSGNQPPIAVADATPKNGYIPLQVIFTGSGSTDDVAVTEYLWDFMDGNTSILQDPMHTFVNPGTYPVELIVRDSIGLSDTTNITITVNPPNQPPVAVASAIPTEGDAPLQVNFSGSGSTDDVGIMGYEWDFKDGTSSIEPNPTHTFTEPGTYVVELTVQDGELKAFPTAYGAGANATGGRGFPVVRVTNLNDSGPGSFRAAVGDNRTIVFDVSGTIELTSQLIFSNLDNVTIAGQTAPEGGITITGVGYLTFSNCQNIIVRYLSFRPDFTISPIEWDAMSISNSSNFIFDHISVSWGTDEISSMENGSNYGTYQRFLFAETNKTGSLMGGSTDPSLSSNLSMHYCYFYNVSHRHPNPNGHGRMDIINNVVYNFNLRLVNSYGALDLNHINNYYFRQKDGGLNTDRLNKLNGNIQTPTIPQIYTAGNLIMPEILTDPNADNWFTWTSFGNWSYGGHDYTLENPEPLHSDFRANTQFSLLGSPVPIMTATEARDDILADVGNNKIIDGNGNVIEYTDDLDFIYLNNMINDTPTNYTFGSYSEIPNYVHYINFHASVSSLPINTHPEGYDSDSDGMPDAWESTTYGNLSRDGTGDQDADGYTDLEEYLNLVDSHVGGLNDTASLTVTVLPPPNQPPLALAESTSPTSGDAPLAIDFVGSGSMDDAPGLTFSWDFGDSGNDTIPDPSYAYTQPGSYSAILTVTDAGGLQDSDTLNITVNNPSVNNPPTALISTASPTSGDAPLTVDFIGSGSTDDAPGLTYFWDFGDSGTSSLADPGYTYNSPGNYSAILVVTDVEGLQDSDTLNITVNNPNVNNPPTALISTASPTSGDAPLTVDFIGSGSTDDAPGFTFLWDFGDGGTSTLADPAYTFNQPGSYATVLTVTDVEGLEDTDNLGIVVSDPNQQRIVSFTLINNSNPDEDLFDLTDGMQIDESITQGLSLNIRANTTPGVVGSVFLSISGPLNNTRNENVAPYALYGDNSGNYFGTPFPSGTYTLSAIPFSGSGQSGTQGQSLSIQFSIISQGGAKTTDVSSDTEPEMTNTGERPINGLSISANSIGVKVYPNPSKTIANVELPNTMEVYRLQLYTLNGQLVKQLSALEIDQKYGGIQLYIRDLEDGIYLLYLWSRDLPGPYMAKLLVHKNKG